ncbi:molybdopterin-dependent oxidoreductase [Tsuneonella sp. YG55]|uniref:Molybdopterin-dependent oxidoreductase n=1 Tax=Tsuneonella litorea TaxID=2976475 RepID=A0A9X2W142_9SPHN|nr:molybdopterin-dependent oxidoreductase [Tsuneonella litorea]MCT2559077.1 molybdopterin-dependent oxidoreductase [Tsuneonella litorea]
MAGTAALLAGACSKISDTPTAQSLFRASEGWHRGAQRLLGGGGLVKEYPRSDISPFFRGNGSTAIDTPEYAAAQAAGFVDWRLEIGGLVAHPLVLSLDNIRKLPQRTQVTRHDCVEGWSAIGEWTGPQLSTILEGAQLFPDARYIVFRCADTLGGARYYESIDLDDAFHPQTIIAHMLNGAPLPVRNGAPLRLRVERQLGYKHAKYLTGIEAVASLEGIEGGKGGYWEDRAGYHWYAGI